MIRAVVIACIVGLAVNLSCASSIDPGPFKPKTIRRAGTYQHDFIKLEFPNRIGQFERTHITEYDRDRANVAGHYSLAGSLRGAATIYLYPANANASPPDRDAFIAHFEQTKSDVILGSPLATFLQSGGVEAKINGFELAGAHARYL